MQNNSIYKNIKKYINLILIIITTFLWSLSIVISKILNKIGLKINFYYKYWGKTILWLGSIKVKVLGKENIDKNKSYIIMSNHASLFDIPIMLGCLDLDFVMIAKKSLFLIPVFGWALSSMGYIKVTRKNKQEIFYIKNKIQSRLKERKSIVIFPESSRSKNGKINDFKKGPFILAKQSKADIIPISVIGSYELLPRQNIFKFNPGDVKLIIHKPVGNSLTIKNLIFETHRIITESYNFHKIK